MYSGAGSSPLLAAAAAWDGLAEELGSAAVSFGQVTSGLTAGVWQGAAAAAMAAAAAPYAGWLGSVAAAAEAVAGQARVVVDFGALPPEINSGRMYCGPGSGPMLAAAAAWDGVAVELGLAATGYASVIAELTGAPWVGAASLSMVAAATPYVAWLSQAAARAEQAGMQAAAAAAAYEAAFVMTVPPPVITANRVLVMTLIATNFFGQNSAAIAVAEAQYAEMWAQDAVAMYGYAAASASASRLIPFAAPPKTTNSAGVVAQG